MLKPESFRWPAKRELLEVRWMLPLLGLALVLGAEFYHKEKVVGKLDENLLASAVPLPVASLSTRANPEDTITLGGGCFWCVEAIFNQVKGVKSAVSGYSGGTVPNPTYEQVCSGATGHAESVEITYDPSVLPLRDLLKIFFTVHDPTTPNRQGADVGTQYRSVIFYRDPAQKAAAEQVIGEIGKEGIWDRPIVTQVVAFDKFYPAERYHQEYYSRNPSQPYCAMVIEPKVLKFREKFRDRLKS